MGRVTPVAKHWRTVLRRRRCGARLRSCSPLLSAGQAHRAPEAQPLRPVTLQTTELPPAHRSTPAQPRDGRVA